MKTPPFLLGATLLFWGWQSNLFATGALMAVVIEGARFVRARWDFSEDDFARIWTLCAVLFLAAFVYAFTNNEGIAGFRNLFENPSFAAQRAAGTISARTAATFITWLPMLFFVFIIAQVYNTHEEVPLASISLILRWWRKKQKARGQALTMRMVNVSYPYFMLCLIAASIQVSERSRYFFWGLSALLAWGFWPQRSRWFSRPTWVITLGLAIALGFGGQWCLRRAQRLLNEYNASWLSEIGRRSSDPEETRTRIGKIGRVKGSGRIIIRVEPKNGSQPPLYLREASYRIYKSTKEKSEWTANSSREVFENTAPEVGETSWPLLRSKVNTATNSIACYLTKYNGNDGYHYGLLPLPSGCGRLENLPAYGIQKNSAGAVMTQGPGLVIFDACHGPGATIDSPPGTNDVANVPQKEISALDQIITEMQFSGRSIDEILFRVRGFLLNNFTYSTWESQLKYAPVTTTPLSIFLLKSRSGHCEYFATATVLILRRLGVPARYAVGYAVHEPAGEGYVVRDRDAHAWCLVWRNGIWEDFDTTPPTWQKAEARNAPLFESLSDGWSRIIFELSKFRWGHARLQEYLLLATVPVIGYLVYQIAFRRKWRLRRKKETRELAVAWPGLDSEFYQLEKQLARRGFSRGPDELLSDWLERALQSPALADLRDRLRSLLRLHYRHRFDPCGLGEGDREELRRGVKGCLVSLGLTAV